MKTALKYMKQRRETNFTQIEFTIDYRFTDNG